ncbi:lysozyme inhibitor LprI family protein [Chelativorans sp. YIM 93263]|uniref:lysozyme inhibitor LprI family protein n=1 Tax=Chelativorans sp. YIM 93263 TaxID=2906648 RepID=UPI00237983AB|nr:hypothetical protein [Chelativorans sp. YIM 93263]
MNRSFLSLTTAVALSVTVMPQITQAASFDCSEAEKPDEIAVCNTPELSALDSEMGALWFVYSKMPLLMGASGARHDAAEAFLKTRSECGSDTECLRNAYQQRIATLKEQIERFMPSDPDGAGGGWSSSDLPAPVQSIVAGYSKQCEDLGGTLTPSADRPMVMTGDLDGDFAQDFVLNPQNMECSAAATAFCGNGGCQIELALSSKDYQDPTDILGGAPRLVQDEEGTTLEVWVDGSNCDTTNAQACLGQYGWDNGALDIDYESREEED